MSSLRKFRFPIFVSAGIVAAGALVYMTNPRINSRQTQGAIGNRSVYRDSKVDAADVQASPGSAPVAGKVLLESKEFKSLAKNQAFQSLMSNPAFAALSQNAQFLAVLQNANFVQMLQNAQFVQMLNNGVLHQVVVNLQNGAGAQLKGESAQALANGTANFSQQTLTSFLNANSAQSLVSNPAFSNLMYNANFLSFMSNQANSQALANLISPAFSGLLANSQFHALLNQSSFLAALQSGSMSSLNASLQQALIQ